MGPLSESIDTDVLVVGAGPGGSAAAYYLARSGSTSPSLTRPPFPERRCAATASPAASGRCSGWASTQTIPASSAWSGRAYSRDARIELRWPELDGFPDYGLVRTRHDFDELLADGREGRRPVYERTEAVAPVATDGWITARVRDEDRAAPLRDVRAKFVLAADGAASRFASQAGVRRDATRPLGIAARRYFRVERRPGPWFESWLDLWEGDLLLPGYGWLFPVSDGTLNIGAGMLNTFKGFKDISAQRLFDAFVAMLPPDWRIGEETAEGAYSPPAADGVQPHPVAQPGLLVLGDAAGIVNPFNGEGIAYAMESAEVAAEPRARRAGRRPVRDRDDVSDGPRSATAATSRWAAGSRERSGIRRSCGRRRGSCFPTDRDEVCPPGAWEPDRRRGGGTQDKPCTRSSDSDERHDGDDRIRACSTTSSIVILALALAFGVLSMVVSRLFRPHHPTPVKLSAYECGIEPERLPEGERFSVKFYLVAMLFIIFDVETIFLFVWAICSARSASSGCSRWPCSSRCCSWSRRTSG